MKKSDKEWLNLLLKDERLRKAWRKYLKEEKEKTTSRGR